MANLSPANTDSSKTGLLVNCQLLSALHFAFDCSYELQNDSHEVLGLVTHSRPPKSSLVHKWGKLEDR